MVSRLTERAAREIAMAWRDQLQGRVRLEITSESLPVNIVSSFEWVTFVFDGSATGAGFPFVEDSKNTAAYARAVTTAWFALSCCDGYSGAENPQFWKRVFGELTVQPLVSDRPQRRITNAVRFFPHVKKPFPRIKLVVGEADAMTATMRIFLGRISHPNNRRDAKLQRILTKLQPWIQMERWIRRVPVQVGTQAATKDKIAALLGEPTAIAAPLVPTSNGITGDFLQMQRIQSVAVHDCPVSAIESLFINFPPCDVNVIVQGRVDKVTNRHVMRRGLFPDSGLLVSGQSQPRWRLDQLTMIPTEDRVYSHLSVVCSALPHTKSITTIMLPTHRLNSGIPRSIATDWAWFGYAIFHPDAASQSGFTGLKVVIAGIAQASIVDLTKMSFGNNLLGGDHTGTAYHEAHVRPSTVAWINPENEGVGELYTFSSASWVSVCVRDASTMVEQDWICIVVPGVGSGWVHSSGITEFRSRPPGKSCLRALSVHCGRSSQDNTALVNLLNAIGDQLTSLHLESGKPFTKATVHSILRQCPSLKSLRLYHDGSFWADEELAMTLPRLEELELTIDNSTRATHPPLQVLHRACVPRLKTLRVVSYYARSYRRDQDVISAILANLPELQYLHWSLASSEWTDPSGSHTVKATDGFVQQLPPASQVSHTPMQLPCKLAFLSVIHHNCVPQLAHDVVSLVFQYATSTTTREICIESASRLFASYATHRQ